MDDLLANVLEAYGGIDRWAHVHAITARLAIGGLINGTVTPAAEANQVPTRMSASLYRARVV